MEGLDLFNMDICSLLLFSGIVCYNVPQCRVAQVPIFRHNELARSELIVSLGIMVDR